MPPASVIVVMLRSWIRLKGASRTISTRRRRSLSTTSAARDSRVELTPLAISPTERMEAGAISMPRVRNDPEDIGAPTSLML
ncbi:hypothetical protein NRB20_57660 [Nocardia sp. RB20]|uniref:Uncharacterized protein n=1 Tax=Nocardia macrotermitis TaxID=2585198 RepID=A0A7K0DAE6_9NOCA|nr:hypothetical protein [Nocardia macrotermitis]